MIRSEPFATTARARKWRSSPSTATSTAGMPGQWSRWILHHIKDMGIGELHETNILCSKYMTAKWLIVFQTSCLNKSLVLKWFDGLEREKIIVCIWFLPTSGISSCGISQGKIILVNWLLCYGFFDHMSLELFIWFWWQLSESYWQLVQIYIVYCYCSAMFIIWSAYLAVFVFRKGYFVLIKSTIHIFSSGSIYCMK